MVWFEEEKKEVTTKMASVYKDFGEDGFISLKEEEIQFLKFKKRKYNNDPDAINSIEKEIMNEGVYG